MARRRRGRGLAAGAGALALLVVCAAAAAPPKRPPAPPSPAPGPEETHTGRIDAVRTLDGPVARLTRANGKALLLAGPQERELRRLGGHRVRVTGVRLPVRRLDLPVLRVRRYTILGDHGPAPEVGRLRAGDARTLLLVQPGRTLTLKASRAMTRRLRRKLACKVWVAGKLRGHTLRVRRFGWLDCTKAPPVRPRPERRRTR